MITLKLTVMISYLHKLPTFSIYSPLSAGFTKIFKALQRLFISSSISVYSVQLHEIHSTTLIKIKHCAQIYHTHSSPIHTAIPMHSEYIYSRHTEYFTWITDIQMELQWCLKTPAHRCQNQLLLQRLWMSVRFPIINPIVWNTYVYSLSFANDQVLLAQDRDDMEYMARKLKEECENWRLTLNLERTKYVCMWEGKEILTLILRRSRTGTVWFYTSTSNKRAARPNLYTKSLTRDLKLMYSRLTLVRISIKL